MIKSNRTKCEGELLIRRMCEKAQEYYSGTDGIIVHADSRNDDVDIHVSFDYGQSWETYNFDELENAFVELMGEC